MIETSKKFTRKVRKSGNSVVVGIPMEVLEDLQVESGSEIEYTKDANGVYTFKKASSNQEKIEMLNLIESLMDQYDETLRNLVDR